MAQGNFGRRNMYIEQPHEAHVKKIHQTSVGAGPGWDRMTLPSLRGSSATSAVAHQPRVTPLSGSATDRWSLQPCGCERGSFRTGIAFGRKLLEVVFETARKRERWRCPVSSILLRFRRCGFAGVGICCMQGHSHVCVYVCVKGRVQNFKDAAVFFSVASGLLAIACCFGTTLDVSDENGRVDRYFS